MVQKGINDSIRLSAARMSGTVYATVVLHTSPEAAIGGPLALVQNGDLITLDVPGRNLHLHVDDAELEARRAQWQPPAIHTDRGYVKLYRSEERRVGKEGGSTGRSRGSPQH